MRMTREVFFPKMINEMDLKFGVEVGVGQGNHSKNILSKTNIMLYCVDLYHDDFNGIKSGNGRYEEAKLNLKEYIDAKRAVLIRGDAVEKANNHDDNLFDFCYIDGDHTYEGVKRDVEAWYPKVKKGGLFCGHDYKDRKNCGVKSYMDKFAIDNGYEINVVQRINWWFIK